MPRESRHIQCLKIGKYPVIANRPPDEIACLIIIYFISQPKHVVGTQKNRLEAQDGSFEHPKQMFKLMDKEIIAILRNFFFLTGPMSKR